MDLERLRNQESDAFAELVTGHQAVVMGLGQSLGLRGPDLDDAAAEAFAAVYRALPRFQGNSEVGTWVYRIAYRVILKCRTKVQRNRPVEIPEQSPAISTENPGTEAEKTETAAMIWSAVGKLDPRQASVVELFYRREWSVEKIAEVLECPTGTVKTHLHRARQKLREVLSRQEVYP